MTDKDGLARVVVVTGGARGIGRAIVEAFTGAGDTVAILDADDVVGEETAAQFRAGGHRVTAHAVDVTSTEQIERAIADVVAQHGPIDVLCNNAGIGDGLKRVADTDDETLDRVIAVNLRGPFVLCRTVLSSMLERGAGIIVNIASVAGLRGARSGASYTASKHGVIGLTTALAAAYADQGIRCNAICPGGVASGMPVGGEMSAAVEADIERIRASMPRRGNPEEIAAVALFLASAGASFMNGSSVVVDGGWTAS